MRSTTAEVPVRLTGGTAAMLRPLEDGETEPLLEVFAGMSAEARFRRYLMPVPRLPATLVKAMSSLDGQDQVAWLASVDERPAGVARYVRLPEDRSTAEVAFEVVDAHHGRGLATALLDAVTTVACVHGVREVTATVLPENAASRRLLARLGMSMRLADGLLEGRAPLRLLEPARVDRAAVVALATRPDSEDAWATAT